MWKYENPIVSAGWQRSRPDRSQHPASTWPISTASSEVMSPMNVVAARLSEFDEESVPFLVIDRAVAMDGSRSAIEAQCASLWTTRSMSSERPYNEAKGVRQEFVRPLIDPLWMPSRESRLYSASSQRRQTQKVLLKVAGGQCIEPSRGLALNTSRLSCNG